MIYYYECQSAACKFLFEIEQSVTDKKRFKKCPQCSKYKLERVLLETPLFFVEQEATTVGQLMDRNTKKHGEELHEKAQKKLDKERVRRREAQQRLADKIPGARIIEHKEPEAPWFGRLPKKVAKGTTEQQIKYIREGKVPL